MAGKKILSGVHLAWPSPNFTQTVKTHKNFKSHFQGAMLYAHYELSGADLKKEVLKYLKTQDPKHPLIDKVKDKDENRFTTVGKYMYILNHGADIPDEIMPKLMPALEKIIREEEEKEAKALQESKFSAASKENDSSAKTEDVPKVVVTIQERLRDKAREVAGEMEGWLDDLILDKKSAVKTVEEFVALFKANELKGPHMKYMREAFTKRAEQAAIVAEGKDKELAEGYSCYTKTELKKFSQFYQNILQAADMMQEAAKVVRAPRKKKPVSHDKLIAKLKFKKEDASLGIVSISPVQIIGAKELWVYNTKTRKLAQYKAIDADGLSVKGASIVNFSTESKEKTVRKPAETLADFKKASKVKLRTFLKDLSTVDVPAGGKINEHHVLLRVDK